MDRSCVILATVAMFTIFFFFEKAMFIMFNTVMSEYISMNFLALRHHAISEQTV